jgi:hypothetical protein
MNILFYHYQKNPDSLSLKNDRENKKRRKKETHNNFSDIQKILSRREDYNKYKEVMNWRMKHLTYHESFLWRLLKNIMPYGILKTYRKWKNK